MAKGDIIFLFLKAARALVLSMSGDEKISEYFAVSR